MLIRQSLARASLCLSTSKSHPGTYGCSVKVSTTSNSFLTSPSIPTYLWLPAPPTLPHFGNYLNKTSL